MPSSDLHLRHLRTAYVVGAVALFVVTLIVAAALGHSGWPAVGVGVFLGLFAGGGFGLLVAARLDQPSTR